MNELEIDNNITHRSDTVVKEHNFINSNENKNTASNIAKSILLYKNGDKYFPPKRFVVNKKYIRTWDSFLEELTKSIQPRSGAIRDIRTPFHGTRIRSLDDLMINGKYVAIPNGETMKLIDYSTVVDVTSPASQTKKDTRRLKPIKPVNQEVEKSDNKTNQQLYTKGMIIYVYRNGDPFTRGIKIILNQFEQKHMSILVRAIEERVLLPSNRPIRKLYTMEGEIIRFAKDIENGQYYVAASNEQFDNIKYGQYLPVIRAGKVPLKSNDNKINNISNPKTSRTQKKEVAQVKDPKEMAALQIQAAFRAYTARNAIHQAQDTNTPIPHTIHKYRPQAIKRHEENGQSNSQPVKQQINRNKILKKDNTEKPKEKDNTEKPKEKDNTEKPKERYNSKERNKDVKNNTQDNRKRSEQRKENNHTSRIEKKSQNKEIKKENNIQKSNLNDRAASKIQAGFRGYLARKPISEKSEEKINDADNKVDEIAHENKNVKEEDSVKKKDDGEKTIENDEKNDDNTQHEKERERAAMKIQAGFRGYKTRSIAEHEETEMKVEAAKVIQNGYRMYMQRKQILEKNDRERKHKAAMVIQAGFRGYKTRQTDLNARLLEKTVVERNNAAARIQAAFRGHSSRMIQ